MKLLLKTLLMFFLVANSLRATSLVATSNTGGSSQAAYYTTRQTLAPGDSVTGMVRLAAGALLTSGMDTVTWNNVLPFAGPLYVQYISGYYPTLTLNSDFNVESNFRLASVGSSTNLQIYGGGYSLTLSGSLALGDTGVVIADPLVINGQGNSLTLSGYEVLQVDAGISVTLRNMTLICDADASESLPIWAGNNASITLDNVDVVFTVATTPLIKFAQSHSFTPNLFIKNKVRLRGVGSAATFNFNSGGYLKILSGAQLTVEDGINFSFQNSSNSALHMADNTSKLFFDNSTLTVPQSTGLNILGGTVVFDNLVHVVNTGATDALSSGVVFGDGGNASNDVDVLVLSGATVIVDGFLQHNPAPPSDGGGVIIIITPPLFEA